MKIKIIFDKEKIKDSYCCGWGTSFLIGEKVLFDAGEKPQYLLNNIKELNIDVSKIEKIVISHKHWDHTGGLEALLSARKNIEVFVCSDLYREFRESICNNNLKLVENSYQITKEIYTTGAIEALYEIGGLKEQALLIKTDKGLSVVCGCSHPGILKIISRAKELFPQYSIYSVIGGFHFMNEDSRYIMQAIAQMKKMGVKNIGPSHCTGVEAIKLLKNNYRENFLDIKVGKVFEL